MKVIYKITGGRPMRYNGFAFVDRVSGVRVNYYTDKFDNRWLANRPWSKFRVWRGKWV